MTTISARYNGQLRTEASHLASGNSIITDAPVDNNGRGEAFSPTDLVCSALGSCMMTIMGIVAERNQIDITGMQVDVTKKMATDPRRISEVILEFKMPEREYSQKEKMMLENA